MEITVIVNGKKLVDSIEPDLLLIDFQIGRAHV